VAILGDFWAILGNFGAILAQFCAFWGHFRGILRVVEKNWAFYRSFGQFPTSLGPSRVRTSVQLIEN
jgi:hypothetical protein